MKMVIDSDNLTAIQSDKVLDNPNLHPPFFPKATKEPISGAAGKASAAPSDKNTVG